MKFVFSPDVILCGWLGSEHQLTNQLTTVNLGPKCSRDGVPVRRLHTCVLGHFRLFLKVFAVAESVKRVKKRSCIKTEAVISQSFDTT